MQNLRTYGKKPFRIAVLHGGPGAAGEMAPVARELSATGGVLEPLQTAPSIKGQVRELLKILQKHGDLPCTLIGWSWGAWLGFIFAAAYPELVRKLILVSSGPFEEKYATGIMATRLSRFKEPERAETRTLMQALNDPATPNKDSLMPRFGQLLAGADFFDPLPSEDEPPECRYAIYQKVWQEASEMRSTGKLLALGGQIRCPVVAVHGDYDPHPAAGVREPLLRVIRNFRFILLENCGHCPWQERAARDHFYAILKNEI